MLIMAVSGAAVLALVCWAALRERAPAQVIPQTPPSRHVDEGEGNRPGGRGSEGEGERQRAGGRGLEGEGERQRAGGRGLEGEGSDGETDALPCRPLAGTVRADADGLHNTTFADADTDQALAAAAALWNVMAQNRE